MIKLGNSIKRLYSTRRNKQERREAFEDRDKVQILGAMELPNGDVKNELLRYQLKIIGTLAIS